jgi:hypothetical protein
MTASRYCEPADIYAAMPPGSFPNPGRLLSDVETSTEIMSLDGHGFSADDALTFRAEEGGSLPAPIVEGTTYYAIPLTGATFSVAATAGGSAINLTTAGSSIVVVRGLPFDAAIEEASAQIDEMLPAHVVPLTAPYPVSVKNVCARLAARALLAFTGGQSQALDDKLQLDIKLMDRWLKAVPIRGAIMPPSANLAVTASTAGTDSRGWFNAEGSLP